MYFSKDYLNKALINGPKEESIDEISKYIYSNRLIIFFILFMSYLFVSYSVCPQKIESAFSRNATMIYIISLACGVIYDSVNYDMVEQALLVKIKNKYLYYIGRIIALKIIKWIFPPLYEINNAYFNINTIDSNKFILLNS